MQRRDDLDIFLDFLKDQLFTEISPGLRIEPGIKLAISKDGYKPSEFIIWYRIYTI